MALLESQLRPRHTMRQIAATRHRGRLLQQIASCDMWKSFSLQQNFVAVIYRTNSNWLEFVRQNLKSTNEEASISFSPC